MNGTLTDEVIRWCQSIGKDCEPEEWPEITSEIYNWIHMGCPRFTGKVRVVKPALYYTFWNNHSPAIGLFTTTHSFDTEKAYQLTSKLVFVETEPEWFVSGIPEFMFQKSVFIPRGRTMFEGMIFLRENILPL